MDGAEGTSVRGRGSVDVAAAGACSVDGDVARLAALNEARAALTKLTLLLCK